MTLPPKPKLTQWDADINILGFLSEQSSLTAQELAEWMYPEWQYKNANGEAVNRCCAVATRFLRRCEHVWEISPGVWALKHDDRQA